MGDGSDASALLFERSRFFNVVFFCCFEFLAQLRSWHNIAKHMARICFCQKATMHNKPKTGTINICQKGTIHNNQNASHVYIR